MVGLGVHWESLGAGNWQNQLRFLKKKKKKEEKKGQNQSDTPQRTSLKYGLKSCKDRDYKRSIKALM